MRRGKNLAVTILAMGILGSAVQAQFTGAPQSPKIDWQQRLGEELPLSLRFTDSSGSEVELADCFSDKP